MEHDYGLLMLAIESILADCGRLGLPWGEESAPDEVFTSEAPGDMPPMPSIEWACTARLAPSEFDLMEAETP